MFSAPLARRIETRAEVQALVTEALVRAAKNPRGGLKPSGRKASGCAKLRCSGSEESARRIETWSSIGLPFLSTSSGSEESARRVETQQLTPAVLA